MAKWYGVIGYEETVETEPGLFEEKIEEHSYYGDVIRNTRHIQNSGEINDNININNQISILADPYANKNFHKIRYVEFMGTKWKVSSVDASQYPRLLLTLGGVYTNVHETQSEPTE